MTDDMKKELNKKLSPEAIKKRKQGGVEVDYIDGWIVIENANRIFGYDGWNSQIIDLKEVLRERFVNKKTQAEGYRVCYICQMEVNILGKSTIDIGYGSGVSYSDFGDATESAVKEAATDALKRGLRFKGNQFGLALYDKAQRNVDFSIQDKLRMLCANNPTKLDALKSAISAHCKMAKVKGGVDDLTFESATELYNNLMELV